MRLSKKLTAGLAAMAALLGGLGIASLANASQPANGTLTIQAPEGGDLRGTYNVYQLGTYRDITLKHSSPSAAESGVQTRTDAPSTGVVYEDLTITASDAAASQAVRAAITQWNNAHSSERIGLDETGFDPVGEIAKLDPYDATGREQIAGVARNLQDARTSLTRTATITGTGASQRVSVPAGWYLITKSDASGLPILLGTADPSAPLDTWLGPSTRYTKTKGVYEKLGVMLTKDPGTPGNPNGDIHPAKKTLSASGQWVKDAAIRLGDSTQYQLKLTLPTGQNGAATRIWVTDTMSNITLKHGSLKAYVNHAGAAGVNKWVDPDKLPSGWKDVTSSVKVAEDGAPITVTGLDKNADTSNLTAPASGFIADLTTLLKDQSNWGKQVTMYVTGTPHDDQGDKQAVQSFVVSTDWSHDPGKPDTPSVTPPVKTLNKSYPLKVVKTDLDDTGLRLAGAAFVLSYNQGSNHSDKWQKLNNNVWSDVASQDDATVFTTGADGTVTIPGLGAGTYTLKETHAPQHYSSAAVALPTFKITVADNGVMSMSETTGKTRLLSAQEPGAADGSGSSITVANIHNLTQLPQTGTAPMLMLTVGVFVVLAGLGTVLYSRGRRALK